jgi:transcriptional regulator with XRE-family HTH domain
VTENRVRRARQRAGLTVGQAARLLGITRDELKVIESPYRQHVERAMELAQLYGVHVDWLTGKTPIRDYAAIDRIAGADRLGARERDDLAELMAASSRRRISELKSVATEREALLEATTVNRARPKAHSSCPDCGAVAPCECEVL